MDQETFEQKSFPLSQCEDQSSMFNQSYSQVIQPKISLQTSQINTISIESYHVNQISSELCLNLQYSDRISPNSQIMREQQIKNIESNKVKRRKKKKKQITKNQNILKRQQENKELVPPSQSKKKKKKKNKKRKNLATKDEEGPNNQSIYQQKQQIKQLNGQKNIYMVTLPNDLFHENSNPKEKNILSTNNELLNITKNIDLLASRSIKNHLQSSPNLRLSQSRYSQENSKQGTPVRFHRAQIIRLSSYSQRFKQNENLIQKQKIKYQQELQKKRYEIEAPQNRQYRVSGSLTIDEKLQRQSINRNNKKIQKTINENQNHQTQSLKNQIPKNEFGTYSQESKDRFQIENCTLGSSPFYFNLAQMVVSLEASNKKQQSENEMKQMTQKQICNKVSGYNYFDEYLIKGSQQQIPETNIQLKKEKELEIEPFLLQNSQNPNKIIENNKFERYYEEYKQEVSNFKLNEIHQQINQYKSSQFAIQNLREPQFIDIRYGSGQNYLNCLHQNIENTPNHIQINQIDLALHQLDLQIQQQLTKNIRFNRYLTKMDEIPEETQNKSSEQISISVVRLERQSEIYQSIIKSINNRKSQDYHLLKKIDNQSDLVRKKISSEIKEYHDNNLEHCNDQTNILNNSIQKDAKQLLNDFIEEPKKYEHLEQNKLVDEALIQFKKQMMVPQQKIRFSPIRIQTALSENKQQNLVSSLICQNLATIENQKPSEKKQRKIIKVVHLKKKNENIKKQQQQKCNLDKYIDPQSSKVKQLSQLSETEIKKTNLKKLNVTLRTNQMTESLPLSARSNNNKIQTNTSRNQKQPNNSSTKTPRIISLKPNKQFMKKIQQKKQIKKQGIEQKIAKNQSIRRKNDISKKQAGLQLSKLYLKTMNESEYHSNKLKIQNQKNQKLFESPAKYLYQSQNINFNSLHASSEKSQSKDRKKKGISLWHLDYLCEASQKSQRQYKISEQSSRKNLKTMLQSNIVNDDKNFEMHINKDVKKNKRSNTDLQFQNQEKSLKHKQQSLQCLNLNINNKSIGQLKQKSFILKSNLQLKTNSLQSSRQKQNKSTVKMDKKGIKLYCEIKPLKNQFLGIHKRII